MSPAYYLRIATLQGSRKLLVATRHNRREFDDEPPNINRSLSYLNYTLFGAPNAKEVVKDAKTKMQLAGITKLRKNGVAALEVLFSLPSSSGIDHQAYFADCLEWCKTQFGASNILSADVHLDEAAPHCHVLILPLIEGRMRGNQMCGNRHTLAARHLSFYNVVSKRYGIGAPKNGVRIQRGLLQKAVIAHLQGINDPSLHSCAWSLIRGSIARDPQMWVQCLGIEIGAKAILHQSRSFVQIMTKKIPMKQSAYA